MKVCPLCPLYIPTNYKQYCVATVNKRWATSASFFLITNVIMQSLHITCSTGHFSANRWSHLFRNEQSVTKSGIPVVFFCVPLLSRLSLRIKPATTKKQPDHLILKIRSARDLFFRGSSAWKFEIASECSQTRYLWNETCEFPLLTPTFQLSSQTHGFLVWEALQEFPRQSLKIL